VKRYGTLVGGIIYMFYPGALYIDGVISSYIAIYFDVPKSRTSNLLPTSMVFQALVIPFGTYLIQHDVDPKISILIGASIGLFLQMIATFTTNYSFFFWTYSLSFSLLNGFTYMVPVHNGWLWFPSQPGLVSGLVIGGFGLSALLFDNFARYLINPDNLLTDNPDYTQTIFDRFTYMLRVLWACYLLITVFGLISIWKGPKKEVKQLENFATNSSIPP
jgi:hypothetical protein